MKLKRTNGPNHGSPEAAPVCVACNGSGYYDDWDYRKNQPIPCDSCDGTGLRNPPTKTREEN